MKAVVVRALGLIASTVVAGAAGAQSPQPIEWKVSEGGNGHWYQAQASSVSWSAAASAARDAAAHLVTFASSSEQAFVVSNCNPSGGSFWIGLVQDRNSPGYREPAGGWGWVTGEPMTWLGWTYNNPNDDQGNENVGEWTPSWGSGWNDMPTEAGRPFVMEWSADCNGDGIVDYGQIRSGQLDDDNSNGTPDICEASVTGVVPPSVPSQGGSSLTIKGNNFPENPTVMIGGVPATDVVRVSATRITAVSPALLPGMAAVKVNDFTLAEALYIRPECGSDLDQDGEVTASDIAIVLLDFGPCYATANSTQPTDSRPFMLREQSAPVAPRSN